MSDVRKSRRQVVRGLSMASLLPTVVACPFAAAASNEVPAFTQQPPETDAKIERMAEQVVDALEGAYGVNTGLRRNHTKGVGALGTFVGSAEGAALSRSTLFAGSTVEVVARFSLAGGDPRAHDAERSARGLGLEFRLPGGGLHHITMLHTPMFFARIPQTFLDKFLALAPDPATGKADPERLTAFNRSHHDTKAQTDFLLRNNPPRSYANCAFYGIHTFRFLDKHDRTTFVRFSFVPRDGEKSLSDAELAVAPRDFLEAALFDRLDRGPIIWDMIATIGEPGDSIDDPTVLWPDSRRQVKVGVLTIHSAMVDPKAGSHKINFDPMMLSDGIAATDDPILLFRSPSYVLSHTRRLRNL